MSDSLIWALTVLGGLLAVGLLIGVLSRHTFSPKWLLVSCALFIANDAAHTRLYGLLPSFIDGNWNWQGKILAFAVTIAVASTPAFGWVRSGLTLKQDRRGLLPALVVSALLIALFTWFAIAGDAGQASSETIAYQLTLPGIEEEAFYRGILLLALNEAFRARIRALGIDWGWGALISSVLFGLVHGFGYSDGAYSFDAMAFALTGGPALILVWLRERTGSILIPILLHNFANSIGLFI